MKNRFSICGIILIVAVIFLSYPTVKANDDSHWKLLWGDEFNKNTLDTSNWTYDIGTGSGGWGNNELEYYTKNSKNVRVLNGKLIIQAKKESKGGMNYTSGRIKSKGLKEFKYGKIEAKIKLPEGQGLWPAFWMLGSNFSESGWPKCGEIDIMEHINKQKTIFGTIHWDANGHSNYGGKSSKLDVTKYHVYSVEWNSNTIQWYVDGNKYWEANITNNVNSTEEFHKKFFILLNLAVGGEFPKNPDSSTNFPAKMYVDYVRVYQKSLDNTTETSLTNTRNKTWYLYNTAVTGIDKSQVLQNERGVVMGWQPTKIITGTPSVWTTKATSITYPKGTWEFTLWSDNPKGDSNVKVDIFRVDRDGGGAKLLGTETKNIASSGSGNHATVYLYHMNPVTLKNQRIMIKICKKSGENITICYNTNDFPTRLDIK